MSIYEKYMQIFNNPSKWDYYNNGHGHLMNPFEDDSSAEKFILEYFDRGAKIDLFDKNALQSNNSRNTHSVSSFFLGIIIKPLLKINVRKNNFLYLWFLSCLYHDYAYYIESNKVKYPPYSLDLKEITNNLKIQHNLLDEKKFRTLFTKQIITQYFIYCQKEQRFLNHGIIAGMLIYDRLITNYKTVKMEYDSFKNGNFDNFEYKNLYWSNNFRNYAYAARAIIDHNIWFAPYDDSTTKNIYKNYKLDDLIFADETARFECKNNLLFLLLLCDTIEPVKEFTCFNPKAVLEKIDIEIIPSEKKMEIRILDTDLNYRSWFNKILYLNTWLGNVTVTETTDLSPVLTISLK